MTSEEFLDPSEINDTLVEKRCSVCGKISWDNETGTYNETHVNKETGKIENCDSNNPA